MISREWVVVQSCLEHHTMQKGLVKSLRMYVRSMYSSKFCLVISFLLGADFGFFSPGLVLNNGASGMRETGVRGIGPAAAAAAASVCELMIIA